MNEWMNEWKKAKVCLSKGMNVVSCKLVEVKEGQLRLVCFVAMTHYNAPRMGMGMGMTRMMIKCIIFAMGWKKEAKVTYVNQVSPLLLLRANDKKAALCFERRTTYN